MDAKGSSHLHRLLQQIDLKSQKSAAVASDKATSEANSGFAESNTKADVTGTSGVVCDDSDSEKPYMDDEELSRLDKIWQKIELKPHRIVAVATELDDQPEEFWKGECEPEGSALATSNLDDKPKACFGNKVPKIKLKTESAMRVPRFTRKPKQANAETPAKLVEMYLHKVHGREKSTELKTHLTQDRVQQAKLESVLTQEEFHIISMAYFCRTVNDDYVPAELGVIRYSLDGGVKEQLHMHINPRQLPYGLKYVSHYHTQRTHGLPLPPNALGSTDYDEIATKLLDFLDPEMHAPLLLFTNANDVLKVESMLNAILDKRNKAGMLYVCSLAELFYQLQLAVFDRVDDNDALNNHSDALNKMQSLFDMDCFSYTSGISCDYHESNDLLVHCALSECIRWSYAISAMCCKHLDIPLIPGKHMPAVTVVQAQHPTTTVRPANVPANDPADDESNYADSVIINDNMSFVSYATDYTDMPPAEVQSCHGSVCNGDEILLREYGLLDAVRDHEAQKAKNGKESSSVNASKIDFTNGTYTLSSYGRSLIYGDSVYEHGGKPRKSQIHKKYYK